MQKFKVRSFTITQISAKGVWLVETKHQYDIAMLFFRAQEFYESSNPEFRGKTFLLEDYMRWYSLELSEHKAFTYAADWQGFNLPSEAVLMYLSLPQKDTPTSYDLAFRTIVDRIEEEQSSDGDEYYLIGVVKGDTNTIEHELSHAMWKLQYGYRRTAENLIASLPKKEVTAIRKTLRELGYANEVVEDEIMAYLGTGLDKELVKYEYLRMPFMTHFYNSKTEFLKG